MVEGSFKITALSFPGEDGRTLTFTEYPLLTGYFVCISSNKVDMIVLNLQMRKLKPREVK